MKLDRRQFVSVTGLGALAAYCGIPALGQEGEDGQALPSLQRPEELAVADLTSLPKQDQLLLTTLQGLVNRRRPEVYLYLATDDAVWLDRTRATTTPVSDPLSLIDRYRDRLAGAIVYDPAVPDTLNVATSLAGLSDAVVATADQAAAHQLPIVRDLRGQFSGRLDAYRWLLDNHWRQLNHKLLVGLVAANPSPAPNVPWTTLLQVTAPVTDASNKASYTADLSSLLGGAAVYVRFGDAYPKDGWGPSVGQITVTADGQTLASFQPGADGEEPFLYEADSSQVAPGGWRFADGNNYFIYKFAPPSGVKALTLQVEMWNEYQVMATNVPPLIYQPFPNFRDYAVATRAFVFSLDPLITEEAALFGEILDKVGADTPYLGWFPQGHEDSGVSLCGQHDVRVVAADYFNNGTVWAGVPAPVRRTQPAAPVSSAPSAPAPKVYLTLTMSEGDNLQYCEHRLRMIWDDAGRGKTPLNWSISPLLLHAAPAMLAYFQQTQSPNDLFVAGPSGAGYTYPGLWSKAGLADFTRQTGIYMRRTGMDIIYALNRSGDTNVDLTDAVARQYRNHVKLQGILSNWVGNSTVTRPAGLPVITQIGIGSVTEGQAAVQKAIAGWNGSTPLFVALGVLAWNMTPTDVNTLAASLPASSEIVRADTFFQLLAQTA